MSFKGRYEPRACRHKRGVQPFVDSLIEDQEAAGEAHQYKQPAAEQSEIEMEFEPEFSQLKTVLRRI